MSDVVRQLPSSPIKKTPLAMCFGNLPAFFFPVRRILHMDYHEICKSIFFVFPNHWTGRIEPNNVRSPPPDKTAGSFGSLPFSRIFYFRVVKINVKQS